MEDQVDEMIPQFVNSDIFRDPIVNSFHKPMNVNNSQVQSQTIRKIPIGKTIKNLFKNPTYVCTCITIISLYFVVTGI